MSGLASILVPVANVQADDSVSTVCPASGPGCDHTSIQAAVDAAAAGTTILVGAGTYREAVRVSTPVVLCRRQAATSRCADVPGDTVIDARDRGAPAVTVDADGVTVRGFTLRTGTHAALAVRASGVRIADNVVRALGPAVHLRGGQGHRLSANTYLGALAGVVVDGASGVRSVGDTFLGVVTGIELRAAGPGAQPHGAVVRDADLKAASVAIRLAGAAGTTVQGVVVDARNNDWGAYVAPLVEARVFDGGVGNAVLQVPYRMPG